MNNRKINFLNRLAKKAQRTRITTVMFDGGDGLLSLREIVFLPKGQDYADEDCLAVYSDDIPNWYYLEDCSFFILSPYK